MEIGEKIKSLRLAKHMTQAELAGDQITRNMLSLVENGSALPSLPTVIYLSERLGISAGMLLAREEEEAMYRKISELPNIKSLYAAGEYRLCIDICESLPHEQMDDEINLVLSKCWFELAKESFNMGHLHRCVHSFDKACEYSRKTIYSDEGLFSMIATYFEYMLRLSPTLSSDAGNDAYDGRQICTDEFCRYAISIKAYDDGSYEAEMHGFELSESGTESFSEHLKARSEMKNGDFSSAKIRLKRLLNGELECCVIMYDIFKDLEECCRLTDDYRGAYEYSVDKVNLLERMLREDIV